MERERQSIARLAVDKSELISLRSTRRAAPVDHSRRPPFRRAAMHGPQQLDPGADFSSTPSIDPISPGDHLTAAIPRATASLLLIQRSYWRLCPFTHTDKQRHTLHAPSSRSQHGLSFIYPSHTGGDPKGQRVARQGAERSRGGNGQQAGANERDCYRGPVWYTE